MNASTSLRPCTVALIFGATLAALVGPVETAAAQPAPSGEEAPAAPRQPQRAEPDQFQVIPLEHAPVMEVVPALRSLLANSRATLTFDQRTNALLVKGAREDIALVERALALLDVPIEEQAAEEPAADEPEVVRLLDIEHADVRLVADVVQRVFPQVQVVSPGRLPELVGPKVAVDPHSRQIIVRATEAQLDAIASVVDALDRPARETAAPAPDDGQVQLRLIWLTSGAAVRPGPLPPDLQPVLEELAGIGMEALGVGAHTLIRTTQREEFQTSFVAELETSWHFRVSGVVEPGADDRQRLRLEARAEENVPDDAQQIRFETTITAPSGHFVVLAAGPVGDMDSVFVVQLRETRE